MKAKIMFVLLNFLSLFVDVLFCSSFVCSSNKNTLFLGPLDGQVRCIQSVTQLVCMNKQMKTKLPHTLYPASPYLPFSKDNRGEFSEFLIERFTKV